MPTTKKHLDNTIIWCENQILNSERTIKNELSRIDDLIKLLNQSKSIRNKLPEVVN